MNNNQKHLLSIAVPVYNEEENIKLFYETVMKELKALEARYDYEFIFTDNRSTDGSFRILREIASVDLRVKVIRFSKNFGYQRSIFTGYCLASGDAVIQMDCDLQDPPILIHEFLAKWEEGYEVVYGIRKNRQEGWLIHQVRRFFYRFINLLSEDDLPKDAGDFRLVDRKVVSQLKLLYDANPYIRGMIAAFGFRQTGLPYNRSRRLHGESKFNLRQLGSLAVDGLLNHSIVPLRLATFIGLFLSIGLTFYVGWLFTIKFIFHQGWPAGFFTLSALILMSISLNALFLGVIGEYIGRIYRQVKRQPITIVDEAINLLPFSR